jgi:polysaccharide export outer membrane protein
MLKTALLLAVLAGSAAAQNSLAVAASQLPSTNLPAQKIGPNDLIAISIYDAPELTRTVRVSADGRIRLPMVKQTVKVEGLLPSQVESAVANVLKAEQILTDPIVTITIVEYHSRPISVAGAVKNPVTFQAIGPVTLLEAVTRAGGLNPDAGSEILVTRSQPREGDTPISLTQRIAVKSLIDGADPEANVKLTGGEEIRIPEVGKVFVVGNVKRPGAFAVQDGSETTVLKMLAMAEGLQPYAAKQAYIIRSDDQTSVKNEIAIELKKIMERKAPDVQLLANDILYIPDNSGRRATMRALERITGFGAATASGVIIWGSR